MQFTLSVTCIRASVHLCTMTLKSQRKPPSMNMFSYLQRKEKKWRRTRLPKLAPAAHGGDRIWSPSP